MDRYWRLVVDGREVQVRTSHAAIKLMLTAESGLFSFENAHIPNDEAITWVRAERVSAAFPLTEPGEGKKV